MVEAVAVVAHAAVLHLDDPEVVLAVATEQVGVEGREPAHVLRGAAVEGRDPLDQFTLALAVVGGFRTQDTHAVGSSSMVTPSRSLASASGPSSVRRALMATTCLSSR